jgi:hypothetical protein
MTILEHTKEWWQRLNPEKDNSEIDNSSFYKSIFFMKNVIISV